MRLPVRVAVAIGSALVALAAGDARPFAIDAKRTFLGGLGFHGKDGAGIHEQITRIAILRGGPPASVNLIAQIQAGVENTDITHQFDGEYHFDNASAQGTHYRDLRAGFLAIQRHLKSAKAYAAANAEFLSPTYPDLRSIASALGSAMRELANHPDCRSCSKVTLRARSGIVTSFLVHLTANPYPDPHPPTSPNSVFAPRLPGLSGCVLCGLLFPVSLTFRTILGQVESAAAYANRQAGALGTRDPLRTRIRRIFQAVRAYRGYQDLGHAFHATQDFFAHTNYVELMAGVDVERRIPARTIVAVPTSFADFSIGGLRRLMGAERFARLESGGVATIWLGEGDYCLGSPFNPNTRITIPLPRIRLPGGRTIGGPVTLPTGGKNPDPPSGLRYCHYKTKTAKGLNKDEPGSGEPSHANHAFARSAATKVSILLWQDFLRSIGAGSAPPPPPPPPPARGAWTLVRTELNPGRSADPPSTVIQARSGHVDWTVTVAPQADFDIDYAQPPARLAPGATHSFPVTVAGRITGGRDTQGFRTVTPILLVNDRWDGRTAVEVGQNCNDPIGAAPITCTEPASARATFSFSVPRPFRSGETFTYGVGALNCGPCYVRYTYRSS